MKRIRKKRIIRDGKRSVVGSEVWIIFGETGRNNEFGWAYCVLAVCEWFWESAYVYEGEVLSYDGC